MLAGEHLTGGGADKCLTGLEYDVMPFRLSNTVAALAFNASKYLSSVLFIVIGPYWQPIFTKIVFSYVGADTFVTGQ